jgi:hypothetical protein
MNHPDALSEKRVWIPKHKKSKKPFGIPDGFFDSIFSGSQFALKII